MNKLMYRFVATTKKKKKKRNRPVLRHGMPPRGIPRNQKAKPKPILSAFSRHFTGYTGIFFFGGGGGRGKGEFLSVIVLEGQFL